MHVQVRLTGVARIARQTQPVTDRDGGPLLHLYAAGPQVSEQDIGIRACIQAAQHHMIARQVVVVHLGHRHVAQAVHSQYHPASAGRQHARTVDAVGLRLRRLHTARPQSEPVELDDVNAIRLSAPLAKPGAAGIKGQKVRVGVKAAAAVDDKINAALQRERQ